MCKFWLIFRSLNFLNFLSVALAQNFAQYLLNKQLTSLPKDIMTDIIVRNLQPFESHYVKYANMEGFAK